MNSRLKVAISYSSALVAILVVGGLLEVPYRFLTLDNPGVASILELHFPLFVLVFLIPCWWLSSMAVKQALQPLMHQLLGLTTGALCGLIALAGAFLVLEGSRGLLAQALAFGWWNVASFTVMAAFAVGGWLFGCLGSVTSLAVETVFQSSSTSRLTHR